MKTVACPSCNFVNAGVTAESKCTQCGESLAAALFQQSVDELKRFTENLPKLNKPPKSFYSINGFGTTLLDYRQLPDGTYEATRWVVALFLPLVPLATYIIEPTTQERSYGRETSKFSILGKSRLAPVRVARTYLLAIVGLLPIVLGSLNSSAINRALSGLMAFGLMILCFLWAVYIIFFKIKNEGKAYRQQSASPTGESLPEANRVSGRNQQ